MGSMADGAIPLHLKGPVLGKAEQGVAMAKKREIKGEVSSMPLRVVGWYLGASSLWILFSDLLLGSLVRDRELLTAIEIAKGWIFLLVTGVLLYTLIRRGLSMIARGHQDLALSEAHYRMLFDKMENGFALHETICDGEGNPVDFRFLEFNPGYEKITGLKAADVVGRGVREVLPAMESLWIEMYRKVATTGEPVHFAGYSQDLGRYYEVNAYRTEPGKFAVVCTDVSEKRLAEVELRRLYSELELRVEERTAQYADANDALKQEIRQRMQAEEEISWLNDDLLRQKTELEAANRELEAFSFSVSHDLRSPLRHIGGFAQVVLEDYGDRVEGIGLDYLKRIVRLCQNAEGLIDELLELARISRSEVDIKPIDLSRMAEEIAGELAQSDTARKVSFTVAPGMAVRADATLVRVVLTNLLGNAYKYTGKRVSAAIEFGELVQGGERVFYVRDNGAGFDMKYADKLFSPFQRLHRREDFEGSGVGLAIVQRIVHRHGGKVWGEAELAKGATFYFTLSRNPIDN